MAAPAFSKMRTYTQNDGSSFEAIPKGDEYLNYIETKSGDILLYNPKTKNYAYATIKNDQLVPSGKAYRDETAKRSNAFLHTTNISKEELGILRKHRIDALRQFQNE